MPLQAQTSTLPAVLFVLRSAPVSQPLHEAQFPLPSPAFLGCRGQPLALLPAALARPGSIRAGSRPSLPTQHPVPLPPRFSRPRALPGLLGRLLWSLFAGLLGCRAACSQDACSQAALPFKLLSPPPLPRGSASPRSSQTMFTVFREGKVAPVISQPLSPRPQSTPARSSGFSLSFSLSGPSLSLPFTSQGAHSPETGPMGSSPGGALKRRREAKRCKRWTGTGQRQELRLSGSLSQMHLPPSPRASSDSVSL